MRFSFLLFFSIYIQIFAQSTIFVKYKSYSSLRQDISKLSSEFNKKLDKATEKYKFNISTFVDKFGKLDDNLNRIIEIDVSDNDLQNVINALNANPDVAYFHQQNSYKIDLIPSDSLYSEQWSIHSINADKAWDIIPDNENKIIIALIDTGIDYKHPDIDNNIFINEGEYGIDEFGNDKSKNGIDDDDNGFIDDYRGWDFVNKLNYFPIEPSDDFTEWDNDPDDEHGHGTNMAGIIAAEHNQIGIAGINPKTKILNLRAFDKNGNGEEDDAASAIIYAVKMGAKVINMSWGDDKYSQVLNDVIEYAYNQGVVLVASSGNNGSNLPHYPSGFQQVINVGSIQQDNSISSFSNYGSTIDLVAPGSQIITLGLNNSYKKVSGTSISAPFISAAASLLLNAGDFENEEVKQILKSTATDLGNNGWDEIYGAGKLNLYKALSVLSPSLIKINSPIQDFATNKDSISINITCLSPYFKEYELYIGEGLNPDNWKFINLNGSTYQKFNETVTTLSTKELNDTSYTLRMLVKRIDGNTLEERVNFYIDRERPAAESYSVFSAMLNDELTVQASIISNEPTIANLYYRRVGEENFKKITLDGFTNNIKFKSTNHFGILPIEDVRSGINHEFYFELIDKIGLKTIVKNNTEFFRINENLERKYYNLIKKDYALENGRIFTDLINISGNQFLLNNSTSEPENTVFNQFDGLQFIQKGTIFKNIPISSGDFNNDGLIDILGLFVKNGFIYSQDNEFSLNFSKTFSDTSGAFWPSLAEDIDNDGKTEIIVFSSDTTISIYEVRPKWKLDKEAELSIFNQSPNENHIFRNNISLVNNFDNDQENEIAIVDNYGIIYLYQINGSHNYENEKVISSFLEIESDSRIEDGDFNGDGKTDIAIISNFEENIFETPLIYSAVITLGDSAEYLHQNMFITTESNFVNKFSKQYQSIKLTDLDSDGSDELVIFSYPNSYIFGYDGTTKLKYYSSNVNAQNIFIDDIDENGLSELGIPNGDSVYFYEFTESNLLRAPIITEAFSISQDSILLRWNNENNYKTLILRGDNPFQMNVIDSSASNLYYDDVNNNTLYYYAMQYKDENGNIISSKSNIIEVYSHKPAYINEIEQTSNNTFDIHFSDRILKDQDFIKKILILPEILPRTAIITSDKSLKLFFNNDLAEGNYSFLFKSIRDFYHSPIKDTIISIEVKNEVNNINKLYIISYNILSNKKLEVEFNFPLEELSALNLNNYEFSPDNKVEEVKFSSNEKTKLELVSKNPFGSVGKEYVLKFKNLRSSENTGSIPLMKNSGSEIVLTNNAENLDNIYVYPNPVKKSINSTMTFANLPARVDIYIFTIDGIFVNKIEEVDGNGGVDWDMTNSQNNLVNSGIYIYKAISKDNFGKEIQEKIGKFAVIR